MDTDKSKTLELNSLLLSFCFLRVLRVSVVNRFR